jgi:PST family polysaccharide transporter
MLFSINNLNAPLARIMIPTLSRLQDDPLRYRRAYLLAARGLSAAATPGIFTAAICSRELVPFLLGEEWRAAGPIFFWLSLTAIIQTIQNSLGWVFISTGRTRRMMQLGLVTSAGTVFSFFLGVGWGAEGVALAYFLSQVAMMPLIFYVVVSGTPIPILSLYTLQLPALFAGAITWWLDAVYTDELGIVSRLIVCGASAYALAVLFQFASPQGRSAAKEIWTLGRRSFGRRG